MQQSTFQHYDACHMILASLMALASTSLLWLSGRAYGQVTRAQLFEAD